ncbi:MAG: hypothetical protein U1E37_11415 [Sphingomonadaceae bacterium]
MKKWQFPLLFVTIVAAVAIGMNLGAIYDSVMLSVTGDCRYWHANISGDIMSAEARADMSTQELTCALKKYTEETRRRNDVY